MTKSNFRSFGMLVVAAMALLLLPVAANAEYLDFWVEESAVPGVPEDAAGYWADAFNGSYAEILTFDGVGGFSATLVAAWSQYLSGEGLSPIGGNYLALEPGLIDQQYGMYTVYTATGNIFDDGGSFRFTTNSGTAEIWIDPDLDTVLGEDALPAAGGLPAVLVDATDDLLVMSATDIYFEDNYLTPGVGGFFDIRFFEPTIEAFGQEYWPTLFGINFLAATVDGDFNEFDPTAAQNITTGGDLSANFTVVPEPSTLVLFGLGLIGTAVAIRRKR